MRRLSTPSSTLARYYELLTVNTKQGEAAGLLRRDSVGEIVLGPAPGVDQTIPFKEIKKAKYSNASLMPEVFDHLLKPNEIADLVAYRLATESLNEQVSDEPFETEFGEGFRIVTFHEHEDPTAPEILALVKGDITPETETLTRVHALNLSLIHI